jgi:hypothetical protein
LATTCSHKCKLTRPCREISRNKQPALHHVLPGRCILLPVRALGKEGVFKMRQYSQEKMDQWLLGDHHDWISARGHPMLDMSLWPSQPDVRYVVSLHSCSRSQQAHQCASSCEETLTTPNSCRIVVSVDKESLVCFAVVGYG